MSDPAPIRCALCRADLEPSRLPHGIVWICRSCEAGAVNLGVFRQVVPRGFVNHLWRAVKLYGLPSRKTCPSCAQPLLEVDAKRVQLSPALEVCCRCFLVWLERPVLARLRQRTPRLRSSIRELDAPPPR